MSCKRTREVLDAKRVLVLEERSSSKEPLSDGDMKRFLSTVDTVVIAKGKASRQISAKETKLDDLRGPTGRFRAPMVRKGKTLLVGFSPEALARLMGE